MTNIKYKKIFFGWYVAAACCMVYFAIIGMFNNSLSHFIIPVTQELGIARSSFMAGMVITQLVGMAMTVFAYKIFARVNYRLLIPLNLVFIV